jgi:hypothetical protein
MFSQPDHQRLQLYDYLNLVTSTKTNSRREKQRRNVRITLLLVHTKKGTIKKCNKFRQNVWPGKEEEEKEEEDQEE